MSNANPSHFPAIKQLVQNAFPNFDEGAVLHASNKITNEIRRSHQDCYDIEVSSRAMPDRNGYYKDFTVPAAGVTVFVRMTVD